MKMIYAKGRSYEFDEHFFDIIDTSTKAYWLGFLLADGGIYKNRLYVELNCIDKEHIELFANHIQSSYPIQDTRHNCCRLEISSQHLVQQCEKHGLVPRKTANCKFPTIDANLKNDCVRGILDGDGWFIRRKPTLTRKPYWEIGFSSGSELMIKSLHEWGQNITNKSCGYLLHRIRPNGSVYQLTFGGNKIVNLLVKTLYDNDHVSLLRKKQKAIQCLSETC